MTILAQSFEFDVIPVKPYNFNLTVRTPAGWALFTPFEEFKNGVLWTATHFDGVLAGVKLQSRGGVEDTIIHVIIYTQSQTDGKQRDAIRRVIRRKLGADQDLKEFYGMALADSILSHAVDDLYGMHDTFPHTIFPEAVLAILLQMAPLKRSNEMMASVISTYGDEAEFDGKLIHSWPLPVRIAGLTPEELAQKCKVGYRAKHLVKLAGVLEGGSFPEMDRIYDMDPESAKKTIQSLPGIGDYSADIINPHGGFPIDVWSAEVFSKLLFGEKPENNRAAVERVKKEGMARWGKWSWMAFFYIVQDLPSLSGKLGIDLRLT